MLHKNVPAADNHVSYTWTYASAALRTAATGFVSGDIGKIAWQTDTDTLWLLKATTPTWVQIGSTAATNLTYTAATGVVANSNGTGFTIPAVASGAPGLAPSSGGGTTNFLRADGTWAAPPGGVSNLSYTAATGVVANTNGTGFTIPAVASGAPGLAPSSGGGTTNFLRADGTWAAPVASAAITVLDEGTSLTTALSSMNFVGTGVTATNTGGAVTVTIPGGGGGSSFIDLSSNFLTMGA